MNAIDEGHHAAGAPGRPGLQRLPQRVTRRTALAAALACWGAGYAAAAETAAQRWYRAAEQQKALALSWGDQPYGAVLVLGEAIVGEGPSRVVQRGDADAHAEREAIRDAQRRLSRSDLAGAVLYSTSRPCALCQQAAERAGIRRFVWGPALTVVER